MIRLLAAVASRHLLARQRQTVVSLLGIVLGVSFFLSISSMMQGSENDFIHRLVDNSPHIGILDQYRNPTLQPLAQLHPGGAIDLRHVTPETETRGIRGYVRDMDYLRTIPGLRASAVLAGQALLGFAGKQQAITLNGITASEYTSVSTIDAYMVKGRLADLVANPNGIVIGDELARVMGLALSDNVGVSGAEGQTRTFKIVGLFHTGRSSFDSGQAFVALKRVQALLDRPNRVNSIVIKLDDPDQARDVAARIEGVVGYKSISWQEQSQDLMSTLLLRRIIMYTVVGAVLVVAAFGIYNVISTVVLEKQRDIAILKSMGFRARDVERIFVLQGALIGLLGNVFGLGLGCGLMVLLGHLHFRFPGSTDVTYMAMDWGWPQFAIAGSVAMGSSVFAALLPARRAARVEPVDVLRGGT